MLGNVKRYSRIYLAYGCTDLRFGIDGLARVVQDHFSLDPFRKGWSYVKKKYKLNVNSTLIFLIILFQFQVFSILSSIFSHIHSAIRNCNDYESLLYYKMFLYTQIQVCTHAYNP